MIFPEVFFNLHPYPSKEFLLIPLSRRNISFIPNKGFRECESGAMFSLERQEVQRLL